MNEITDGDDDDQRLRHRLYSIRIAK